MPRPGFAPLAAQADPERALAILDQLDSQNETVVEMEHGHLARAPTSSIAHLGWLYMVFADNIELQVN